MAVEVIRTTASRRLMIFGSGTCSTRTSFLPYQQFALITSPFSLNQLTRSSRARHLSRSGGAAARRLLLFARDGLRGTLREVAVVPERAVGDDDLARLHQLLEGSQRLLRLLPRLLAEELRDERAECAARRRVVDLDFDYRAAVSGRGLEAHGAGVVYFRAF